MLHRMINVQAGNINETRTHKTRAQKLGQGPPFNKRDADTEVLDVILTRQPYKRIINRDINAKKSFNLK
jgi:hypothetical protein